MALPLTRPPVRSGASTSSGGFRSNVRIPPRQRPRSRAGLIFRKAGRKLGSRLMLFQLIEGLSVNPRGWSECFKHNPSGTLSRPDECGGSNR